MDKELQVAKDIAAKAGSVMRQYFEGDQQRVKKADGSPVTVADITINRMVIEELAREFPEDIVIGEEESTGDYGMGRRWICDPIDGTKAFTWGTPTALFSLALVIDGEPVLGVCYEPIVGKLYWATKGGGAFCNGQPLRVNQDTLEDGILGTSSSHYRIRTQSPYLDELLKRRIDMAAFSGAVAKAVRVAEGRFVGYIEELVNAHDIAASQVIVEEAGGKVTDLTGKRYDYTAPFRGTIVSNGIIHDELVNVVSPDSR